MKMNNGRSFKKKMEIGSTAVQFTHLFEKETLKIKKKKTTKQKKLLPDYIFIFMRLLKSVHVIIRTQ